MIFHAAAYKHVHLLETNSKAAIKNNRVHWHEVIVDGYLANGKNVTTKTQKNKKKPRKK